MSERLLGPSSNRKEIELDPHVLEPGVMIKLTWDSQPGPHDHTYTVGERITDQNGDSRISLVSENPVVPTGYISIYEELDRNGFDAIEVIENP